MATTRHRNDGVRKLCDCPRKRWSECPHSWYFNFSWKDKNYRFSLNKTVGKVIDGKTVAESEAERIRTAIRENRWNTALPARETLNMAKLLGTFQARYLDKARAASEKNLKSQIKAITRTPLQHPTVGALVFGDWLVADVTTDTIEQYREARQVSGPIASNRDLALLRSMFNWAIRTKHVAETPFKLGTETVVKLTREVARSRRLEPGEGERLLTACGSHLRALVEAAIETGCRKGELMTLQWAQVRTAPRRELFLPATKTKTRTDRRVPITDRLQMILDMRKLDPEGEELGPDKFVFGNEVGEELSSCKRAWERAVLVAHGHKPQYVMREQGEGKKPLRTAVLAPESRAALRSINLHFHDLRREAGSRWLEGGVSLHTIRDWLGHSNIAQTSTYLSGTKQGQHDEMIRFEARREQLQKLASGTGKRGKRQPRTATIHDNKPRKDSTIRH